MKASELAEFFDVRIDVIRQQLDGHTVTKDLLFDFAQLFYGVSFEACIPERKTKLEGYDIFKLSLRYKVSGLCYLPFDIAKDSFDYERLVRQCPWVYKNERGALYLHPYGVRKKLREYLMFLCKQNKVSKTRQGSASYCLKHGYVHVHPECPVCKALHIAGMDDYTANVEEGFIAPVPVYRYNAQTTHIEDDVQNAIDAAMHENDIEE